MGDDGLHGSSLRPRYAAKKIFLVEIPDVVDIVDDEGAVVEDPILVGVFELVVGVLDEVGPLVEALLEPLVLPSSKSTPAMAGPAKAAVAPVTAATATTERMRLIFANSCVSLVIPGGSPLLQ